MREGTSKGDVGDSSEELRMSKQQLRDIIIAEGVRKALSGTRPDSEKNEDVSEGSSKMKTVRYKQFKEGNLPQFAGVVYVVVMFKWLREMEAVI